MRPWWLRLLVYARSEGSGLLLLALLMVAGIAFATLGPWPMKIIIDYVLGGKPLPQDFQWISALPGAASPAGLLAWLVGSTVLLFIAGRTLSTVQNYVQAGVGTRMVYHLGADLFDHLQRLSLRVHSQQRAGDLVRRVTSDSGCVRDVVTGVFLPMVTSTLSLITMFAVMWQLDRSLSLLALLAAIPLPIFMKILTPRMIQRSYHQSELQGDLMAHVEQTLSALPVVQAFGRESHSDAVFLHLSDRIIQAYQRTLLSQAWFKVFVGAPMAIGSAVIMGVGAVHVLQGSLTTGSLLVFLAYLGSLYGPISGLAYLSSSFASAAGSSRRVLEMLDVVPGVRDAPDAKPLPTNPAGGRGHIQIDDVSFGYESDRAVLRGVTLEAHPGEVVAIVGPTGAGKSTLVSLIPRFFDPWQGRVMVDGIDVRHLKVSDLRAQVALVLQEPFLLPLTVSENIAYGRPEASRAQVIAAAVTANADEFIQKLPQGYDTILGERGSTLSGGEKQRIAIARALLKDAPILILDEPTSALDSSTEALLMEALERLIAGRTTFIIAHRLSTIRKADRIVVLEEGRVVETGTHQELIAGNQSYLQYYNLQNRSTHAGTNTIARRSVEAEVQET